MKEDDFEMEMEGGSEDHEYAMDLIRNLVKVSKEDLEPRILFEVMMVYSLGWNLAHGDHELMTQLLPQVVESIEDGSYTNVAEVMEDERICH
jgi:hypothetical protein|tara:strand:- start:1175 stop:1450 length:276 start_codon:yes stop_codon:yes gene_type:complete